jgi:hypothetical protein
LTTGLSGLVRSDVDLSAVNTDQPAHLRQITQEQSRCLISVLRSAGGPQPQQLLIKSAKPGFLRQRRQLRESSQCAAVILEGWGKRTPALLGKT